MKKLLLIALLAFKCAYADTAATFPNNAGGLTVLTDVQCDRQRGFYAYSQNPRGSTQFGCWWSDSTMVHITWNDGELRSYTFTGMDLNLPVLNRMRARQNKGNV